MKKFIVLLLFFIPVISFAQEQNNGNHQQEDVKITINVTKINKTLGSIVKFVKDETKQFKDEAVESMSDEDKEQLKKAKENIKYELKYTRDAIHAGWRQGWKGEEYTPPYKHK